jgi:Mycothiol maleylpyruvate isomerase N-terminal domain
MTKAAVDGLHKNHEDMQAVFESLTDEEWVMQSACAGWRVQEVLAHVTSNFKEMVEPTTPPADQPPVDPTTVHAEEMVEALVTPRRTWSAKELMDEYAKYRDAALGTLAAMQEEPMASTEIPLADLGTYGMHWLANAYCFDHYCHLRIDTLQPNGPIKRAVPAADDVRVRPGIDWMIAGLAQMCKNELKIVDKPWRLELTGAGAGTWTVHPVGANGLVTVVEGKDDGVATVTSTAHDFVSWGTKRSEWRPSCKITGDTDYVSSVLDAINII